jgi:hypothetical protein
VKTKENISSVSLVPWTDEDRASPAVVV